MATLNGNNAYLSFAGVDVSGYWTGQVDKKASAAAVETTAGAAATHVERAAGLLDNSIKFAVVYDDSTLSTILAALVPGTVGALIYGPEGATSAKPKFEGSMLLTNLDGPTQSIEKGKVQFELSFEGAAAPTSTIEGGSTFA